MRTDQQLATLQDLVSRCPTEKKNGLSRASSPSFLFSHPLSFLRALPLQATRSHQVSSIEFTQIQAAVVHGLEQGSAALKTLQAEVSLDRVERIMDTSREGIEYQREIDEALASHMSPEEEEAVLKELEELQKEQMVSRVWGWGCWVLAIAPPAVRSQCLWLS